MYEQKKKILIISNRAENTKSFELALSYNPSCTFSIAENLSVARTRFRTEKPNLIFCDLILADGDASELLSEFTQTNNVPDILFCVTASDEQNYAENSVLKEGADDFIKTPCSPKVLSKRISALSRRLNKVKAKKEITITDQISLNPDGHTISIEDHVITLPRREFAVLRLFAENPGIIFTREEIRRQIWKDDSGLNPRTVDVHIYNLRNKTLPGIIETVQDKGYIFHQKHEEVK